MTEIRPRRPGLSRETRLLFVTILVSGVVLLLLARLRFPEPPARVDTSAQPLERLAARASFEELATRVARLEESIAPNLIVLRLSPRAQTAPRRLRDIVARRDASPGGVHHVAALRIDSTTAVAAIPPDTRITGIVRPTDPSGTAGIAAFDPLRHLARVRVPEGPSRALPQLELSALQTPAYVVAVEGTQAGLTLRPVFLGRSDRYSSPRWSRPVLPLGGATVTPGALMFTLDGQFLGCAVLEDGNPAVVGAADVLETMVRAGSTPGGVDPGLAVQRLTRPLSLATGAARGVVVAHVADGSPASGVLEPGDVVIAVDGEAVDDPDALLLRLSTRLPAAMVRVAFVRNRELREAELPPAPASLPEPAASGADRVLLRAVSGGTRVDSVPSGSALAEAGLQPEDVIVRIGAQAAPTPAQIRQQLAKTPAGEFLILVLRRGDTQHVAGVRGGGIADAAAR